MPNEESGPSTGRLPSKDEGWPAVIALVQLVLQEGQRQAILVAGISKDLQTTMDEMRALSRLITDDGGDRGLMLRTAMLERTAVENKESLKKILDAVEKRDLADTGGKWTLTNTAMTGLFMVLAALIAAITAWVSKH